MKVAIEMTGGLELLCGNAKTHTVDVDEASMDMPQFLQHVKEHIVQERPELFLQGDTVRPGILVLINEVDWELEDGMEYTVQDGDTIVFISTLHGG